MGNRIRKDPSVRFWSKVKKTKECWNWTGCKTRNGYGWFRYSPKYNGTTNAHRVVFMIIGVEIPDGLTVDHICNNKLCVNPKHLRIVTMRENVLRNGGPSDMNSKKKKCINGHFFSKSNTYIRPDGARSCRICKRETCRRRDKKRKVKK